MTPLAPADDLLAAIENAEATALTEHDEGRCHLSEWSCSYCEAGRAALDRNETWRATILAPGARA